MNAIIEQTMPTVIMRRDHGYRPYRLRCRFAVEAYPTQGWLETARHEAAERFIEDMDKQGWDYMDQHGVQMSGPYSPAIITGVPSFADRERIKAKDAAYAVAQGARLLPQKTQMVASVTPVAFCDKWEFELSAVFLRKTVVMEYDERIIQ